MSSLKSKMGDVTFLLCFYTNIDRIHNVANRGSRRCVSSPQTFSSSQLQPYSCFCGKKRLDFMNSRIQKVSVLQFDELPESAAISQPALCGKSAASCGQGIEMVSLHSVVCGMTNQCCLFLQMDHYETFFRKMCMVGNG